MGNGSGNNFDAVVGRSNEIIVQPINTDNINKIAIDCEKILQSSETVKIGSQIDLDNADTVLTAIKSKIKELEKSKKELTEPLEKVKKRVIELYRQPMDMLYQAEKLLKRSILFFHDKQEKERLAKEEKLRQRMEAKAQKAEEKGELERAEELREESLLQSVAPAIEKPKSISFQDRWYASVINEAQVPNEYKIVDVKKLDAVARATKGSISIPGVVFKVEKIVKSRGSNG